MKKQIIPAGATIDELKKKAAECERQAQQEKEPAASELREKANLYKQWIALLRSGRWTS